jgi:hypothetical protein
MTIDIATFQVIDGSLYYTLNIVCQVKQLAKSFFTDIISVSSTIKL